MKKGILALFFSGLVSVVFVMAYYHENNNLKKITNSVKSNEDGYVLANVEDINEEDGKLLIDGWALVKNDTHEYYNWVSGKGEDVYINNKIVLINEEDEIYEVKTIAYQNEEVNEEVNDGINHKKCGVKAAVKLSKLNKNQTYGVGIILTDINGEEILIKSDKEIII